MYVLFDPSWSLVEAFRYRGSFIEALAVFMKMYPGARSVVIFRDSGRSNFSYQSLKFQAHLSRSQVDRLLAR